MDCRYFFEALIEALTTPTSRTMSLAASGQRMSPLCRSVALIYMRTHLALVAYEYVITLPLEIENIWRRKINITSALLLATRWTLVAQAVSYYSIAVAKSHLVSVD